MANRNRQDRQTSSIPDAPVTPLVPTEERVPPRRRGGQELPDDVQDRPEQNAGYDAAVHGEADPASESRGEADLQPEEHGGEEQVPAQPSQQERLKDIDDRAERGAASDVRWRERINR